MAKVPQLKLSRLLLDLSESRSHGEDADAIHAIALRAGIQHPDPQRPYLSFEDLHPQRDLTVATAGAGGYVVSTENQKVRDILRQFSVTAQMGMTIQSGLRGAQTIPKISVKSTPMWLSSEASTITESTPTFVQIALSPKMIGVTCDVSHQLLKQSNAEDVLRFVLMRDVGSMIDQAVIAGTASSGQPQGLIGTSGVQTQSGTSLNAGVFTMLQKSAEANASDRNITFLSTPAVRALEQQREVVTASGRFVWDRDTVANRPAYVSTDVPTAVMICGDWSLVYLGIWGQGMTMEIPPMESNPYDPTGFKQGIVSVRILVACDVAILHPSSFVTASSIT